MTAILVSVTAGALSKGDQARHRVLNAVVREVGERGLAELSVADIGLAAGMSAGHVLYYFENKDTLFIEALRHSEALLDAARLRLRESDDDPALRLRRYIELYLPTGADDARWKLWVEVWNRSMTDSEVVQMQLDLDDRWQTDLTFLIADGVNAGRFHESVGVAATIGALLDGFAIRMLTGTPGLNRDTVVEAAVRASETLLDASAR